MDQAIHGDDMIENPVLAIQHVTHFVDDAALGRLAFATFTRNSDEGWRYINRQNLRSTPRRFNGESARAATGIEEAASGEIPRQHSEQGCAHLVPASTNPGPHAAHRRRRGQARPGLDGCPVEVGFKFAAALLVFVDVMKELPATLIVRPFDFDTLAVRVHNLASDERLAEASTAALLIVAVGLLPIIALVRAMRRG
jgi:hypothetical protein